VPENAKAASARKLTRLEATWEERHGAVLERVREALATLDVTSPEQPPGTWRAGAKELARLPRFPSSPTGADSRTAPERLHLPPATEG
jgi:hypothetical protein